MKKSITRRGVLQAVGAGAVAGALPFRAKAAEAAKISPVTEKLAAYMSAAREKALPADVVGHAKFHILDTLAAMVSGADLPPGRIALKFAAAHKGEMVATVAASNIVCGPLEAAMANGMLAHSDETDDSHAPSHSHPGCATIPAALAAGEQFGISGTHFLRAVTLGYDIGTRVTTTLGALKYQMETHRSSHSIAENFCAASAAGCAASLDPRQMRFILDYASQQASGIAAWERDTEHIEKSLVFAGHPARNGVSAALLIQIGGSGVEDIFAGTDNFLLAYQPKADANVLIDKLGERFAVKDTTIKKWTVGSPIQAPLDAMENLRKRHPFEAAQVEHIRVRVSASEANTVNNRDMPDICLQHMIAVMLLDKTASFKAAHDKPRMQDPVVLKERAKVELFFDEELEKLIPKRVTIIEVKLTDGTLLTERVEAVRGTPDNPMTKDEVAAKARDLVAPSLGAAKADKLISTIWNIEDLKNIRELRPLIQKG